MELPYAALLIVALALTMTWLIVSWAKADLVALQYEWETKTGRYADWTDEDRY